MADTIFTGQTPASTDFDGSNHGWGMEFTVSDDCACTGGRAYVPNSGRPATFFWQLWRISDATKIAEVNLNSLGTPTNNTWMSFSSSDFSTPGDVDLDSADDYIVNVYFIGDGLFTDPGSFPIGSGGLVSSSTGRFNNGSGQNSMPSSTSATYFFADLDAEAAGGTEHTKSVGGTITPAGAITRAVSRSLAGSTTPTGALSKGLSRTLSGSTTPTGAITRAIGRTLGGTVTLTSTMGRAISRALSGSISPAGALLKGLSRLLGGSVTPTGSVSSEPFVPGDPTVWRAGRPESKWSPGPPQAKWSSGRPEGG